jgi:phospholipid/cholesterol/gamma-HCH transport system ATP-binding protein
MEIGENILYIHEGENWWTGDKHSIVTTDYKEIGDFVYASEFMKQLRGKLT